MASVFDAYDNNGELLYRRDNKVIDAKDVPDAVKEVVNANNIVDENGTIIVDKKNDAARKLNAEDQKALDEKTKTAEGGDTSEETSDTETPAAEQNSSDATPDEPDHTEEDSELSDDEEDEDEGDEDDDEDSEPEAPAPKPAPRRKKAAPAVKTPPFKSKVPQTKLGMGFPRKNGKTVDIFDGETPHTHVKLVGGHMVPLSTENFNARSEKEIENRLVELGFELLDFTDRGQGDLQNDLDVEEEDDSDGLSDDRP